MNDGTRRTIDRVLFSARAARQADDRALRRSAATGNARRLRRGAYLPTPAGVRLDDDERFDAAIVAVIGTRWSDVVLGGFAAARLWGLPRFGRWPSIVELIEPPTSGRCTRNGVAIRRREWVSDHTADIGGVLVTSLPETLAELACRSSRRDSVVALDAALDIRRPRVTHDAIRERIEARSPQNGLRRGLAALAFANGAAQSPLETVSRDLFDELGFERPELQYPFQGPKGMFYSDFWWHRVRVIGEVDGRIKYDELAQAASLAPAEVVWREKLRELDLRDHGASLVRWTATDLRTPSRLVRRLATVGLRPVRRAHRALPV